MKLWVETYVDLDMGNVEMSDYERVELTKELISNMNSNEQREIKSELESESVTADEVASLFEALADHEKEDFRGRFDLVYEDDTVDRDELEKISARLSNKISDVESNVESTKSYLDDVESELTRLEDIRSELESL